MARGLEEVRVDGELYQIGQWHIDKSLEILVWLTKTVGESIANLATTGDLESLMDKEISEVIGPAITALVPKLQEKEVQQRCRDIVAEVLHEGRQIVYDVHFQGRVGHLFKLMAEVLKVQYKDFFGALSANVPPAAVERRSATTQAN